jgi:hypothetical protein
VRLVIHQLAPCKVGLKKKNKFTPTKSNTTLSPQNQSHKSRRKHKAEKKQQQQSAGISSRQP